MVAVVPQSACSTSVSFVLLTCSASLCRCSRCFLFLFLQPCPRTTPFPHARRPAYPAARSLLSSGGCFLYQVCRRIADKRPWQMSRHHLTAVTCPRTETNPSCQRTARSGLALECDFAVLISSSTIWCVSLIHCSVVKADLRAT